MSAPTGGIDSWRVRRAPLPKTSHGPTTAAGPTGVAPVTGAVPRPNRPGPVFDRAMRRVAEGDLAAFCQWLEVDLAGPAQILSGSSPAATLHTDLLVRVGPQRLMHVEYMRSPPPDLAVRMIGYRASIMRSHPGMQISRGRPASIRSGGRVA